MDLNIFGVNDQSKQREKASNGEIETDVRLNDFTTNVYSQGIELATAVEEAVSSVAQESVGSTLSQKQAWKSVVALATNKLRNLEKQEKQREHLSPSTERTLQRISCPAYNQAPTSNKYRDLIRNEGRDFIAPDVFPAASLVGESLLPSLAGEIQQPPHEGHPAALPSSLFFKPAQERYPRDGDDSGGFSWTPGPFESVDINSWNNEMSGERLFEDFTELGSNPEWSALFPSAKNTSQTNSDQFGDQISPISRNTLGKTKTVKHSTASIGDSGYHITKTKKRRKDISAEKLLHGPNHLHNAVVSKAHTHHLGSSHGGTVAVNVLPRGRPSERGETCAYCMLRHKKCSGNQPCNGCLKSGVYRSLCIPANFSDSRGVSRNLYHARIKTLLDNIRSWLPAEAFDPPITVRIGNGFHASFEIELQAYVPIDTDALTHVLFRGLQGGMIAPKAQSSAFALKGNTLSTKKIDEYCDRLVYDLIQKEASEHYSLANHILLFALNQSEVLDQREKLPGIDMVKLALRFWAIQAIFFKAPWGMVDGADRVGMAPLNIPGFWHNRTLLPRLVNQELDRAFEKRMDEIEKDILTRLQQAVFQEHRTMWCSIFLTSFVLLHSLEKDSWNMHAWEYETNRPGGTPWPLRVTPAEYYSQNQHISEMIAAHFRVVNKGHTAFALDLTKKSNLQLLPHPAAKQLTTKLQQEMRDPNSHFRQQLGGVKDFRREDVESLHYLYTRALVLD